MSDLVVRNLIYKVEGSTVFQPLTLSAERGKRIRLLGPSGSGKSTVCRILAGRLPVLLAKQSQIPVNPYYTGDMSADKYCVPESSYIGSNPHKQILAFKVADLFARSTKDEVLSRFRELSLPKELLDREPLTLSTGEATKVLLGVILESGNELIVLDSPWSWIDPDSRGIIMDHLYQGVHRRVVIESDSIFTPTDSCLQDSSIMLSGESSEVIPLLYQIEEATKTKENMGGRNFRSITISGFSELGESDSKFRLDINDLALPIGSLCWIQGANGSGKTTFARSISTLPQRISSGRSQYKLWHDSRSEPLIDSNVGYVNSRLPIGERRIKSSLCLLINHRRIRDAFDHGCDGILEFLEPDKWRSSPILGVVGATLYHLALGRELIIIDEPFYGATADECNLATSIFRNWTRIFDSTIAIISHLQTPLFNQGEPIIGFKRNADNKAVYATASIRSDSE